MHDFGITLSKLAELILVNPIELLHNENVGEKPPKANWFVGALGLVVLVAAHCIAVIDYVIHVTTIPRQG